jgi:hypothetical protein
MSCRKATGEGRKSGETMDGGRLGLAGWVYDIETPHALLLVSIQIWMEDVSASPDGCMI